MVLHFSTCGQQGTHEEASSPSSPRASLPAFLGVFPETDPNRTDACVSPEAF